MKKESSLKELRKKYPGAAKVVSKFLESECCNEDEDGEKKK